MSVRAERVPDVWPGSAWLSALDAPLEQPSSPPAAAAALAIGVASDVAMRAGVMGLAGTLCVLAASVVMIAGGRVRNPHAVAMIAAAPVFGVFLTLRTSEWLIPLNVLIAAALIGFGASLSRGGSAFDLTIPDVVSRVIRGGLQSFSAPAFLWQGAFGARRASRIGAVARGLVLVVPVVIVLVPLLASADAVFASFFDVDLSGLVLHVALIAFGTLAMGALLRLASAAPADVPRGVSAGKLGAVEATIVLGALNLVLGVFAAARLVALSGGGKRVLESAGLTYAEYARSGFFQLLFAAVVVIATLLAVRATADLQTRARRRTFAALSAAVVVLTLAVCVSAFHRLVLYEAAFGLTMLRLYVQTAIVWVAIVLVLLGIAVIRPRTSRAWLAPGAAVAGLVLVLALNVLNPEALVARHNIAHPPSVEPLDAVYLSGLSDDAVPAIASSAQHDAELRSSICSDRPAPAGWASFNMARERADAVRDELCR